jgi:hypothetical protein
MPGHCGGHSAGGAVDGDQLAVGDAASGEDVVLTKLTERHHESHPAGSAPSRSPDVRGDFTHLLAEDPAGVGIMQQLPKIGFERFAAFRK